MSGKCITRRSTSPLLGAFEPLERREAGYEVTSRGGSVADEDIEDMGKPFNFIFDSESEGEPET